ncbi:MAG: carbon-nitrogen hydrolase family protein [Micromonosporaceae bacterium]|nr:carbon-nitrogen hydrolase family protein [Micromonosporaceae bacterium]
MVDLQAAPPTALTVAVGQAACAALDVQANVANAADLVRRAADQGADLLVLPELFLTGYELTAIAGDPAKYTTGPADPRLGPLSVACGQTGTAAVLGAPTRDPGTGRPFISAIVLDRTGRYATEYNKQHLDPAERAAGFGCGASGCTATMDGWRLGLGICWDSSFPEHARAAALDGCHAYLVGAMFDRGRGDLKRRILGPARALDNACFVAFANHSGRSGPYVGCGASAVWGPDGALLADAGDGEPGVATARLEPAVLAAARAGDLPLADPSLTAPGTARREAALW